jgi:hypothetical protein
VATANRKAELRAEAARTGAGLVNLLAGSARADTMAVDVQRLVNAFAANQQNTVAQEWPRLKPALQVAAVQAAARTPAASGVSTNAHGWEPNRNAMHRLIQLCDVMAIALNRFRQLSFRLPTETAPSYISERQRLRDDFFAVQRAMFPRDDIAPQHTSFRLATAAVAELARKGSKDEEAVGHAQVWLSDAGWAFPTPYPKEISSPFHERFAEEGGFLARYTPGDIRARLLVALARVGEAAPDYIHQRTRMLSHPWSEGSPDPFTQAELLALVRSTEAEPVPMVPALEPARPLALPPANPTGHDPVQHRLKCYPLVPLAELNPMRPPPRDSEITSAMRIVPKALTESRFGGPNAHLPASAGEHYLEYPAWLAYAQEQGLGRAAAEWAVYRLVEAGRLSVVWPEADRLAPITLEHAQDRAERYRGRPATVSDWDLFEHGRILQIRSTPALWDWWRGEPAPVPTEPTVTDRNPGESGHDLEPLSTPALCDWPDGSQRGEAAASIDAEPVRVRNDPPSEVYPTGNTESSSEDAQYARFIELHALATAPQKNRVPLNVLDEYQRLLTKFGVYTVDGVGVGPPDRSRRPKFDPILNTDCIEVPGSNPLLCPRSSPKLPVELLPGVEERFRSLRLVGPDQTVLWVGRQARMETVCLYRKGCDCFTGTALPPTVPTSNERGDKSITDSVPTWDSLGDAKRAILQVLSDARSALQNSAVAQKAGYKAGTLRHHYGELQQWALIESTKDGYKITAAGRALLPAEKV